MNNALNWTRMLVVFVTVFFAAPAQGQDATPADVAATQERVERYVRRGVAEVAAVCEEARRVEALGEAQCFAVSEEARSLVQHCRDGAPLASALLRDDAVRARALRIVREEVARRDELARVCAQRAQLVAWNRTQRAAASASASSSNLDEALTAFVATPAGAQGGPCANGTDAARSGETLTITTLGVLRTAADMIRANPNVSVRQLEGRVERRSTHEGGSVAATAAGTGAVDTATTFISMALEGIARFMQNRARAEIQLYLVDRVREEVCAPNSLGALYLRTTCAFLGTRDDLFAPTFGPTFIAAVADDALHLPARFGEHMDAHKADFPGLPGVMARASVRLVESLSVTVDLAENAAAVRETMRVWCPQPSDQACVQGVTALRVGLALIEGAARHSDVLENQAFRDELFDAVRLLAGDSVHLERARFDAILARAVDVREAVQAYQRAQDRDARIARVEPLANAVIGMFNEALDFADPARALARFPASLASFLDAVARGSVADVVLRATRVALDVTRDAAQRDHLRVSPDVLRVLSLGGDLAAARSAEQVSAAMESFSAPVGSWRLKSHHRFTLSVGGAFGIAGGAEWAQSAAHLPAAEALPMGQLFAPVGIDLSWSPCRCMHVGLLLPIVDVGALVPLGGAGDEARRFSPTSFLAPGAFLRLGFSGVPVVLGAGVSYRPFAHVVAPIGGGADQVDASVAVLAFAAIDVPIYMLWTSTGHH